MPGTLKSTWKICIRLLCGVGPLSPPSYGVCPNSVTLWGG